jgi:hypothetical protein
MALIDRSYHVETQVLNYYVAVTGDNPFARMLLMAPSVLCVTKMLLKCAQVQALNSCI